MFRTSGGSDAGAPGERGKKHTRTSNSVQIPTALWVPDFTFKHSGDEDKESYRAKKLRKL